jgi:hypothetical protein
MIDWFKYMTDIYLNNQQWEGGKSTNPDELVNHDSVSKRSQHTCNVKYDGYKTKRHRGRFSLVPASFSLILLVTGGFPRHQHPQSSTLGGSPLIM